MQRTYADKDRKHNKPFPTFEEVTYHPSMKKNPKGSAPKVLAKAVKTTNKPLMETLFKKPDLI